MPTNVAEARAKLGLERDKALDAKDTDEVARLDEELKKLEEVQKRREAPNASLDRLAELNKRNRERDTTRGNRIADSERASKGGIAMVYSVELVTYPIQDFHPQ